MLVALTIIFVAWRNHRERIFVVSNSYLERNAPRDEVSPPPRRISFIMGGDMMFGRSVYFAFSKNLGESVVNLKSGIFDGVDVALINLEGAISAKPILPDPRSSFTFIFPPETVDVLHDLRIGAVSLDNNHSNNAGPSGRGVTTDLLLAQNIRVLPATFEGDGLKLTIIGIHTLWSIEDISDEIRSIKQDPDQRVVIYPHWGIEYAVQHNKQQEMLAHAWIDAGADAVIGSHPHVIQDIEIYQDKPIVYSMGNLLFDQDWSVATQQGILVKGIFEGDQLQIYIHPIVSKKFQPYLADASFDVVASPQWIPLSSWILAHK